MTPHPDDIIRTVATHFDVQPDALTGPRRFAELAEARRYAAQVMMVCRPEMSHERIAEAMNRKGHWCVSNWLKRPVDAALVNELADKAKGVAA